MVKYNGRKIIYTFKYGAYLTLTDKFLYIIATVFLFLFFGVSLFMICYYRDNDAVIYEGLIVSCIAGFVYLAMTVYYICKAKRIDREIYEWLKDEHLIKAYADTYEFEKEWLKGGSYHYKLGITFENNGEKYSRFTTRTEKGRYFKRLDSLVLNNRLEILYSPKYGEVMVLDCGETEGKRL